MRLPTPKFLANTNTIVEIGNGTDVNGELKIVDTFPLKCRFEQSNDIIYLKEGEKVSLKGKCFFFDNLERFPDKFSGFCTVNDVKYGIANSSKKFNPDGSINHVVLGLI